MSNIPQALIFDILSRLKPKDLIRYMCVSKAWYALIHNQDFIKAHGERSIKTNSTRTILLQVATRPLDFLSLPFNNDEMLGTATKVGRPMISKHHLTNTVGYANGLVAICNNTDEYIALWNPSIQKLKKIPFTTHEPHAHPHPPSPDFRMIHNYGFGYDSTNDDYKLVAIVHFGDGDDVTVSFQVSVYSLKANSWKTIQNMPCCGFSLYSDYLVFSNGALSWLMSKELDGEYQYKILTLDLASEKYREFPIPDPVDGGYIEDYMPDLEVLGGYLCISLTLYDVQRDVWIMKGNGVTESWSLLCSIYLFGKPLSFSENGEMVLMMMERKGYNRLFWYDLEKKKFKKACRLCRRPLRATICRESLCLLLDGDPIKSSKKRKFSNEWRL